MPNLSATYQLICAIEMTFERTESPDKQAPKSERQTELSADLWKNMQLTQDSSSVADPALASAAAHLPGLVLVADNVGKNYINNKPVDYLNSELMSETPVLDNTKLGDTIQRWGNPSQDFCDQISQAWNSLPEANELKNAGVTVVAEDALRGENGSTGLYDPDAKRILIAPVGTADLPNLLYTTHSNDPKRTLKHEAGHALYQIRSLDNWQEFQTAYTNESANLSPEIREELSHMLGKNGQSETYADIYSAVRGSPSYRSDLIQQNLPQTWNLVKSSLSSAI